MEGDQGVSYEFKTYPDREMLAMDLANQIAGELRAALSHQDRAALAVPGGTSPGPVFDALCAADLDWDRVDVLLTDERWVPESSERSNTRLLRERLLVERAAAARYLPLYAEAAGPEERLAELADAIAPALPLAVVMLGMGADLHTASIFPGADKLDEALHDEAPILLPIILTAGFDPIWFGRGQDAQGAYRTVWVGRDNVIGYPDHYVQSTERHPMEYLCEKLTDMGWNKGTIGVEMDNYYYSAAAHRSLTANLSEAQFTDTTGLVNWQRAIKSDKEIEYMRRAARIVEAMHKAIVEKAEPGLPKNELVAEIYRTGVLGADGHWGDYTAIVPMALG